jgi:hypothetical protein
MTEKKGTLVFAIVMAALAQTADVATTLYGIARGATESNPLMAGVLESWGPWGFVFIKLTAVAYFTALSCWNRIVAVCMALPFFWFAWQNIQVIQSL